MQYLTSRLILRHVSSASLGSLGIPELLDGCKEALFFSFCCTCVMSIIQGRKGNYKEACL